jgi:heme oxygenase
MSLKELTAEKHKQAESTQFMRAIFAGTLPMDQWIDYTYQKMLFYKTIEGAAGMNGLLRDLPDIPRAFKLFQDYQIMNVDNKQYSFKNAAVDYHNYLLSINKDSAKIMAHLYVWHMGDLYGGQMIKRLIPGRHIALEFENKDQLISTIRSKLDDSMADEANLAFDWAIRILQEYDV